MLISKKQTDFPNPDFYYMCRYTICIKKTIEKYKTKLKFSKGHKATFWRQLNIIQEPLILWMATQRHECLLTRRTSEIWGGFSEFGAVLPCIGSVKLNTLAELWDRAFAVIWIANTHTNVLLLRYLTKMNKVTVRFFITLLETRLLSKIFRMIDR